MKSLFEKSKKALFILWVGWILGCSTSKGLEKSRSYSRTERARILVQIANGFLISGDATGALQALIRAEEEDKNVPELHHSKGLAYLMKHDFEKALHCVREAVRLKSDYSDANNTLGKLLMDSGHDLEAIPLLKRAAEDPLNRESYKAWTNLGILNFKRANYIQSEIYLDRAVQENSHLSCIARLYRGHIYLKNKKVKDAIHEYSEASKKLCAQFGEAYLALGNAYQQNKEFEMARKTFLEIQQRYPNTQWSEKAIEQLRFIP